MLPARIGCLSIKTNKANWTLVKHIQKSQIVPDVVNIGGLVYNSFEMIFNWDLKKTTRITSNIKDKAKGSLNAPLPNEI